MIVRVFLLLIAWGALLAQQEKNSEFTLGGTLYTYGVGVEGMVFKYNSGGSSDVFYVGIGSLKHAEEEKFPSVFHDQGGKDFIFDKINYAYALRLAYGKAVNLFPAGTMKPVRVQGGIMAGVSIGILTPYYIDVAVPQSGNYVLPKTDIYDPNKYSYYDIIGKTNFFKHIGPLKYYLGFTLNPFVNFNFGDTNEFARMIRLGVQMEIFGKQLPILATGKNNSFWIAPYVALGLGNRN